MNTEKRLLIAVVLSMVVVLAFQKFSPSPAPAVIPAVSAGPAAALPAGKAETPHSVNTEMPVPEEYIAESRQVETKKETERFIITFSNLGGVIKNIFLKGYNTTLAKNLDQDHTIFLLKDTPFGYKVNNLPYSIEESKDRISYAYVYPQSNIKITKKYILSNTSDYIELELMIENLSDIPREISYKIVGPSCIEPVSSLQGQAYVEASASIDGKVLRKNSVKGIGEYFSGIIPWTALKNTYYAIALKTTPECTAIFMEQYKNKKLSITVENRSRTIMPKTIIQDKYVLYMGPVDKKRLNAVYTGFAGIINYGFFGPISVFLVGSLTMINALVHNWGVAIILLTILVNIILFPLTKMSFVSMQRMQEVQPHMEKLRQVHKDNPQKLNKEIMALYKEYNVNPFGGCLPMLLQLPIFFAFYQALIHSLELKNAKFLWIKDLSMPDALIAFPQSYPIIGDKFNLLPILTLVLMVVQQKTAMASQANASPEMVQQQKIMLFMFPLLFGFILYNFPSGLVIYWFTNSLLMTTEQVLMKKTMSKVVVVK